ncbi:MAG: GNAT family N-acetyltransferase [Planctomycetota bacterium]
MNTEHNAGVLDPAANQNTGSLVEPKPADSPASSQAGFVDTATDATDADAAGIASLVNLWADRGLTLRRDAADIAKTINEFVVVRDDAAEHEGVRACGALVEWPPTVAEIRSVSVADRARGNGAGRAIVEALIAKAKAEGMTTVVLLTKTPAFFAKFGFAEITVDDLPQGYVEGAIVGQGRNVEGRVAMIMQVS